MADRFSNPWQLTGSQGSPVYRPKFRQKMANPNYALESQAPVKNNDPPGIMDPLHALEEWRRLEEDQGNENVVRWHPEKAKTLAVYIQPPPKAEWGPIILQACREWESSSMGLVQLLSSVRSESADIRIEWAETAITGRDFEVGHTKCDVKYPGWITQATVTLLIQPEIDKHLSEAACNQRLYTTVLHELGHALGLEHSKNAKDIMYHQGWRNRHLTANDIERLQQLYTRPVSRLFWI